MSKYNWTQWNLLLRKHALGLQLAKQYILNIEWHRKIFLWVGSLSLFKSADYVSVEEQKSLWKEKYKKVTTWQHMVKRWNCHANNY